MAAVVAVSFLGFIRLPVAAALAYGVGPGTISLAGVTLEVPQLIGALGPPGIWWGFIVSNIAGAAIAYALFRDGRWQEGDVRGPAGESPESDGDPAAETAVDD
jgi:Na+-driven multidrug efflux pump